MKQTRKSIFETNSSSTHSVTIKNNDKYNYTDFIVDPADHYIHMTFGEFGWGYDEFIDPMTKLQYLLTLLLEINKATFGREGITTIDEFYNLDEYILIESIVTEHVEGCKGICIYDDGFKVNEYEGPNGETRYWTTHNGYVDHQSCEGYTSLYDFFEEWGTGIEDFIFNEKIELVIDNDNN